MKYRDPLAKRQFSHDAMHHFGDIGFGITSSFWYKSGPMENPVYRYDWTLDEVRALLTGPLDELLAKANKIHRTQAVQDFQTSLLPGVSKCLTGVLEVGEGATNRASLLCELGSFNPHPHTVPIDLLVPNVGTSIPSFESTLFEELLRTIATARIMMPKSRIELSSARNTLSDAEQMLCFQAGANAINMGENSLTTPSFPFEGDREFIRATSSGLG